MVGFYNYSVLLTYLSLCSGVAGIALSFANHPTLAVYCLMFSGLCDGFDGTIARTRKNATKQEKSFGVQIDSLCDLVCFGVLPVCIGLKMGFDRPLFLPILCVYLLAAVIRLAYFNVLTEDAPSKKGEKRYFIGMPVTSIALIFPLVYMLRYVGLEKYMIPILAVLYFIVAIAFLLKFKIPKPSMWQVLVLVGIGAVELVFIILLKLKIFS